MKMLRVGRDLVAVFGVCLLAGACSSKESGSTEGLDCLGVDGTYYFAYIPTGECADQGVTLEDQGATVQNHAVVSGSIPSCSETVTYEGCTVRVDATCSLGVTVTLTQTFQPGQPSQVTGTQVQTMPDGQSCTYEIFGSTDQALVHEHAGVSDVTDISALTTPGTPTPANLSAATADCSANTAAEQDACPDGNDPAQTTAICADAWQLYDAQGCGDAWRAYVTCRTEHVASMDCATGEIADCSVYTNAYFQCQSAFATSTNCSVAGAPATLCAGGLGTYSYGCLGGVAPFPDCVPASSSSSVPMYCCN